MKKKISCFILTIILIVCAGCGKVTEETPKVSLDETKMRSICKLATLDCYYHNVAKYKEEDVSGFLWWNKDKIFWISYGGIVTLGIDADAMQVKIDGSNVEIAIPEVKVLDSKVDPDTLSENSFYFAANSVEPSVEDQTKAYADAEGKMVEEAKKDKALLNQAQQRVQDLLEGYVQSMGQITNTQYVITWKVGENTSESTEKVSDTQL